MATTDIDGTPLLMLNPAEAAIASLALEHEYWDDREWGDPIRPELVALREKVGNWLEENS
jgi:hypothetical protein